MVMVEKTEQWVTQENVEFYKENGFVQIDNVLTAEELEELRDYANEAMASESRNAVKTDQDGGAYYKVLNQKVNAWRDHGGMAKYSLHPRFASIAMRLTEASGIRLFHDHLLWKMPGDSKPTPWHQDTVKWPMNETGALSIWITLDDVDERNGCMMFVPKSHTAGKLKNISLVDPVDIFEYVKGTGLENQRPVVVPLKAGSCTFHDGLTFHYAHSNQTDKPRRVLAIIYMKDGTTYNGTGHVITNEQGLVVGEPIRGSLFPLLAKA
ncbi:phytanoyl-CoA dioxygenase family protein [Paenibacillus ginsengarvi]|uniref:Phytanoyl-CoA dioxygenase family protein n=2 Tax=Paenibacillus ginsengarvi TaxID=400777 RepID=A0A3B0CJY5_9BACL|nr:phytanoyl-CoA dioxygenase family protein [Paenibacillus ginsengarvi]